MPMKLFTPIYLPYQGNKTNTKEALLEPKQSTINRLLVFAACYQVQTSKGGN